MANWDTSKKISDLILGDEKSDGRKFGDWISPFNKIFKTPKFKADFASLRKEIYAQKANGIDIYPDPENVLNVFRTLQPDKIRVVLLGQDPYINKIFISHGKSTPQAHGLSFSVPKGASPPGSLQNIFKELRAEYPYFKERPDGNLDHWAEQGVFLLNTSLTVRAGKSDSHSQYWEFFTGEIIKFISENYGGVVFLLLGAKAQQKKEFIKNGGMVVVAGHPSPINTKGNFIGSNCFRKCNELLSSVGRNQIEW